MDHLLEARPTLRAWLDEYASIEADFLDQLAAWGIRVGTPASRPTFSTNLPPGAFAWARAMR
ncbi:hypothetical protein, partial [Eggerthella sinensis]|uniref:hypothetical protein n=1 Tax=Eggerthella sinensis TaxID=242230 RepID=UPI0022E2B320